MCQILGVQDWKQKYNICIVYSYSIKHTENYLKTKEIKKIPYIQMS
jgi:hypothetical protein